MNDLIIHDVAVITIVWRHLVVAVSPSVARHPGGTWDSRACRQLSQITAAARETAPRHVLALWSSRVAMPLHGLRVAQTCSSRCLAFDIASSSPRGTLRLFLGGSPACPPAPASRSSPRACASSAVSASPAWTLGRRAGHTTAAPASARAWPGVRGQPVGWPRAAQTAGMVVVRPPGLRPRPAVALSPLVPRRRADGRGPAWQRAGRRPGPPRQPDGRPPVASRRLQPIGGGGGAEAANRPTARAARATAGPPGRGTALPPHTGGGLWPCPQPSRLDQEAHACSAPLARPALHRVAPCLRPARRL